MLMFIMWESFLPKIYVNLCFLVICILYKGDINNLCILNNSVVNYTEKEIIEKC